MFFCLANSVDDSKTSVFNELLLK